VYTGNTEAAIERGIHILLIGLLDRSLIAVNRRVNNFPKQN